MSEIIWSRNRDEARAMARWISQRIGGSGLATRLDNAEQAMGLIRDGVMIGCWTYSGYNPEAGVIEISGAAEKGWATRSVLFSIYAYPFNQLGCQMVVQRNDPADHRLNRTMQRYGFRGHIIPRLRGRNKGELIMTLYEEDWRKNGYHKENGHGR